MGSCWSPSVKPGGQAAIDLIRRLGMVADRGLLQIRIEHLEP